MIVVSDWLVNDKTLLSCMCKKTLLTSITFIKYCIYDTFDTDRCNIERECLIIFAFDRFLDVDTWKVDVILLKANIDLGRKTRK